MKKWIKWDGYEVQIEYDDKYCSKKCPHLIAGKCGLFIEAGNYAKLQQEGLKLIRIKQCIASRIVPD